MNSFAGRQKYLLFVCALLGFFLLVNVSGSGVKISNIEFALEDSPGTSSQHEFVVTNDESEPIDITISIGDWYRTLNGTNKFIGKNAARWSAPRYSMTEGEELTIEYRAKVPEDFSGEFMIDGSLNTSRPDNEVTVYGDTGYNTENGEVTSEEGGDDGPVTVTRAVKPVTDEGEVSLTVSVNIVANEDVRGINLSEEFPVNTDLTNVDSEGIPIEYVNRSAADWLEVSPREFTLNPDEEREVTFSVSVPPRVKGTNWAAIYVNSEPTAVDSEGTTVVALKRFAVKVYERVPGTGEVETYVTDFSAITTSIPQFSLTLENKGNVEVEITGELSLRDETGEVVDQIDINTFELLPGYKRQLTLRGEEVTKLPPGAYNAVAILDYGGQDRIGKSISFKVAPLNLQPIGASPAPPTDPDDDGLYEDIDGNGKLEPIDAIIFSFNYDSPPVRDNARAFDFNLDGVVNMADAEELMRRAESG
ncbi:MAG: dockerin type I domain-containing protein [Candidatus Acetothermia bacterium]